MTRIIAGAAGGRRLKVPPAGTRPTTDRVREALFSALAARMDFDGAAVLDLFAGSGALGLEALSRGAAEVVLVESDGRAASVARANIGEVGLAGASVRRVPVHSYLAAVAERRFDLVLADPPYALDDDDVTAVLGALASGGWLAPDAIVVLERSTRAPETTWPDGLGEPTIKKYGETRVEIAYGAGS